MTPALLDTPTGPRQSAPHKRARTLYALAMRRAYPAWRSYYLAFSNTLERGEVEAWRLWRAWPTTAAAYATADALAKQAGHQHPLKGAAHGQ
jgi:hypothetical protein